MTIEWTLYDETTGEVLRTGVATTEEQAMGQARGGGRIQLVNTNPATQIVTPPPPASPPETPGTVAARPATPMAASKTNFTANGVDSVTISSVPAGSVFHISVPENKGIALIPDQTIPDGSLVITTTVAGDYTLTIRNFPNVDFVVTLHAA